MIIWKKTGLKGSVNVFPLGNIWEDFTIDNMKTTGLKWSEEFFSVDFRTINTNESSDIHDFLMKET